MIISFWPNSNNIEVASFRLRCLNVVNLLKKRGVSIGLYDRGTVPSVLLLAQRYDPASVDWALKLKAAHGTRLILDLCDNHLLEKKTKAKNESLVNALRAVDQVVVSSQYLKDEVLKELPDISVTVIDDVIDLPRKLSFLDYLGHPIEAIKFFLFRRRVRLRVDKVGRLVWFGNSRGSRSSGLDSLKDIYPYLLRANRQHHLTLTIISNSKKKYRELVKDWTIPTFYVEWDLNFFSSYLMEHGLAVLPSRPGGFSLAKTNNRVATSIIHGLEVVASAIPSYQEFEGAIHMDGWGSLSLILEGKKKLTHLDFYKEYLVNKNQKVTDRWLKVLTQDI